MTSLFIPLIYLEIKQKNANKIELTPYDYSKLTKNSDNTENTGREITNILASQHSPRYRDDITPINKSLITGRSRSPHFDINDQSNSTIKIPTVDCLNEKKMI